MTLCLPLPLPPRVSRIILIAPNTEFKATCVQECRDVSYGLVEPDDSKDSDDPDGQGLPGAVEVNVLVSRNPCLIAG